MKDRRLILKLGIILAFLAAFVFIRYYDLIISKFPKKVVEALPKYKAQIIKVFHFSDESALAEWEEKIFKGRVAYKIEKTKDLSYVAARSDRAASALYYKVKINAKNEHPVIRWKWKAEKFPEKKYKENLDALNEDDFAARVYVIFPTAFLINSRVLEYIWAETLPVGTTGTSPYSKNIKLIILQSGRPKDNNWISEERDIADDYVKMFGRTPDYDIGAIAFMTNAEHTETSAAAMYGEIELGYKDNSSSNKGGGK